MTKIVSIVMLIGTCLLLVPASLKTQPLDNGEDRKPALKASETSARACGNGMCVKLTYGGGILTSKDGSIWNEQSLAGRPFLRGVAFGQGIFVAVGGSYIDVPGLVITSQDGITWVRQHPQNKINLNSVTYGDGLFVAVGDQGTIFTSQDSVCWKKRPSRTSAMLAAIAFGKGIFVAGGESGTLLTSTNGAQWTSQSLGDSHFIGKVLFRDGCFLFQASGVAFTSADGAAWIRCSVETVKTP